MDTSIRFYKTNSSLTVGAEHKSRTTAPLAAERDEREEAPTNEEERVAETLPSQTAATSQEKVDVADFEAIFLRFQMPLTNFIYHLVGNREQAYDLTQDVFVKAYKALLAGTVVPPRALLSCVHRPPSNT